MSTRRGGGDEKRETGIVPWRVSEVLFLNDLADALGYWE
jgi:hypothetical protein